MNKILYNIKEALPTDAESIAQAEEAVFADPWSSSGIAHFSTCDSAFVLCAKNEAGRLCGYAIGSFAAGEGELLRIAVLPQYRKSGIGTAILYEFIHRMTARRVSALFLEVRLSNTSAQSLYEKAGFQKYAVRRNYYKHPTEDAIMMRIDLDI